MKTLLVIVCCMVSMSAFAQRREVPNGATLNAPNVKPHPADNLPGTELPAMLFPDEKPGAGRLFPVKVSPNPGNDPWSVERGNFLLSLPTDPLHRLVMPPFILTDSLRQMLLLRHTLDRMRRKDTIPHYIIPKE